MLSLGYNQGSLQHLPAVSQGNPVSYGYSNWDRLIACRDVPAGSKEYLDQSRAEMNGGIPSAQDPINLNDPMFFHPQHPRSVENFDMGRYGFGGPGAALMAEKAHAIPSRLYPAYQLPGLTYEMRPNGSVGVLASRSWGGSNKRTMDTAPEEESNKKRRLAVN